MVKNRWYGSTKDNVVCMCCVHAYVCDRGVEYCRCGLPLDLLSGMPRNWCSVKPTAGDIRYVWNCSGRKVMF